MTTTFSAETAQLPEEFAGIDLANLVLMMDCDGVLAPISDDPGDAFVPETRQALVRAAAERCLLAAVVTGRGIERAREMVGVDEVWYATLHGVHIESPTGDIDIDPRSALAREHVEVAATLAQTVGWAFEDKDATVTIHFRQRGNLGQFVDPNHVKAQLMTVLNPLKVEIEHAKQVLEIKPKGVRNKGDAVEFLLDAAANQSASAIYVGDDLTDVHAFQKLRAMRTEDPNRRVVCVAVNTQDSPAELLDLADVILEGDAAVEPFLNQLLMA